MRRILFLTLAFYPNDQSASQLFTDLFRHLAVDADITVLCAFPPKDTTWSSPAVPRRERYHGITIIRCGLRVHGKRNFFLRTVWYASFLLHAAWLLLFLPRKDIVFGVTVPPFTAPLLWATSYIGRFRYGYMLLDVYPEGLVALGTLQRNSLLTRLWIYVNRLSYRRAEFIPVLGRDMIPLLKRTYGIDPRRVPYIPLWSPAEATQPSPFSQNQLARSLGIQNKFVVQYSGNMGLWHDIEGLVEAAHRLRDDDRIHFLFIGKGIRRAAAERLSQQLGLCNITWLDFLPREQLGESLACCHVALISLRDGMQGVAVPSKLYGILAVGRATIAQVPADSEVALALREERCGLVVRPGDVDGLAASVRTLAQDRPICDAMGARAYAAYSGKYTTEHAVAAFRTLWGLTDSASEAPKEQL